MSSSPEADAAAEATWAGLARRQRTPPVPLPADLRATGQTAVVTGSNVGLGLAASRQLLGLGLSHLVMGVRSQAKGDAAASKLRDEFPGAQVSVWLLDMESYDSVREFAARCASEELPRIDVVILNAGLMAPAYTAVAATGHELTLQVNYLSTVLLALLLVPVLRAKKEAGASRPPVLSIVGSDAHYTAPLNGAAAEEGPVLARVDDPKGFSQFPAYTNSKLLLALFVARLAELVEPGDVLINLSNPGMTKGTAFGRDNWAIARWLFGVVQYFWARTIEVGASVYVDAALTRGAESHGKFISDWTIKP
ncbi:hypothetical protein Daus18300_012582 [Diaporthe australafricana]|uniref:Retinol dehydrogenase 12 n=1 Tax=Diaporthe australafricana TaxID=127596 RepID=A0ABR3W225_9PEZI